MIVNQMRLVRIESVRDGMELARDIPAGVGAAPLVRTGVRLTGGIAARLAERGVRAVWIEDGLGEGIVPVQPLPEPVRQATQRASAACLEAARTAVTNNRTLTDKQLAGVEQAARAMLDALLDCPEAAIALDDLSGADSYTYSHSVRVATLGLLLGQRLMRLDGWIDHTGRRRDDRLEERLAALGTGLLIHDIGKISIPAEILNKPGKLTPEEWDLIRMHPDAGVSLLPPDKLSPLSIAVIRDHHERWDGEGYARGKARDEIHQFARIAAVADVYDAVTADRPYKAATAPHVGVRVIREGAGTQFDEAVVEHFNRLVMPYPVGWQVTLPDGGEGVVADVDPEDPDHPTVRFKGDGSYCEAQMLIVDGEVLDGYEPASAIAA